VTIRQAERINGLRYVVSKDAKGRSHVEAWDGEKMLAESLNRKEKQAIKEVVEMVYRIWSREVMDAQGWLCALCGERKPLEIDHHPISRARGQRDDRRSNLRAVCTAFGCGLHAKKHGG
jgi:hypothetical protein